MTLGEKLYSLRREKNYTQEELAEIMNVSRQTISKWESDAAYPETAKLLRLAELYGCSLDDLLLPDRTLHENKKPASSFSFRFEERKSARTWRGLPLWHIGKNAKGVIAIGLNAKGIVAIGLKAEGIVALGALAVGLISFGLFSLGCLLAFGLCAVGIFSAGCLSLGIFSAGAISIGFVSVGAIAVGDFSVGALAYAKYYAVGDRATAMIAIGKTMANGSMLTFCGEDVKVDYSLLSETWDNVVPPLFSWLKGLFLHDFVG